MQLGTGATNVTGLALEHAPETHNAREIKKHNSVTDLQAEVQGSSIVAINDPGVAANKILDGRPPLFSRRWLPAGSPVQGIEVD